MGMGRPGRAAAAVRAGEAREMRTSTWLPPRSSVTLQTSSPSVSSGSASSTRLRTCLRRRLIARARSERERCAVFADRKESQNWADGGITRLPRRDRAA